MQIDSVLESMSIVIRLTHNMCHINWTTIECASAVFKAILWLIELNRGTGLKAIATDSSNTLVWLWVFNELSFWVQFFGHEFREHDDVSVTTHGISSDYLVSVRKMCDSSKMNGDDFDLGLSSFLQWSLRGWIDDLERIDFIVDISRLVYMDFVRRVWYSEVGIWNFHRQISIFHRQILIFIKKT